MSKSITKNITNEISISNNSSNIKSIYIKEIPKEGIFYLENEEVGCKNLSEKLARVKEGGEFEWPNMVALNRSLQAFLNDAKKIVVIGSGTATFEWFATQNNKNSDLLFVASEFDRECVEWCKEHRSRQNIKYTSLSVLELKEKYGNFDLAILVDVIEHIDNYGSFLSSFSSLADKAVITTPNKDRSLITSLAKSPTYYQHVREWNAGEFYWVLKAFYKNVDLYAMPDVYNEGIKKIGLSSTMTPLIAYCHQTND